MNILPTVFLLLLFGTALGQDKTYDTLPNMPDHYVKRYELFKNEPIQKGRVIMVGNSITEGANWNALLKDSTVINRGISGDVTFGVIHRLQDITDRKPSRVFLLIGVNDLSRDTPDEVILENIFMIVGKIHAGSPSTKLYIQSILPINESFKNLSKKFTGKGEHIKTINDQLRKYAKKLNYTFVDLYSAFIDSEGRMESKFTYDGLHLASAGYQLWADILKREKYLGEL